MLQPKAGNKYLQIVKGYENTDVSRMSQLLALVSTSMMNQFNDFLKGSSCNWIWKTNTVASFHTLERHQDDGADIPEPLPNRRAVPAVWCWPTQMCLIRQAICHTAICRFQRRGLTRWLPAWRMYYCRSVELRGKW